VQRLELALEQTPKVQGAFVAIDLKTRGVVALAGGYDVALSSFNRATQAKRQPDLVQALPLRGRARHRKVHSRHPRR